jgi:Ferritin-like
MITLRSELVEGLDDPQVLREALQTAVELEHATIPTYLYALYSIEPGTNVEIASLLLSIVVEEMMHMGLACNILNAIGGAPEIDTPDFVPKYPGHLPGAVEESLSVPLSHLTQDLVLKVFMVIEEPELPLDFPGVAPAPLGLTIGKFYAAIAEHLQLANPSIFVTDHSKQVTLSESELIEVTDLQSALAAIDKIVEQGEGTSNLPTDPEGEIAHYYRFAEIHNEKRLIKNAAAPPNAPPDERFIFAGGPVPFEAGHIRTLVLNPSERPYTPGSPAAVANEKFNVTYTSLLELLHSVFNGEPEGIDSAIGVMESLKQQALAMGEIEVGPGTFAGPSFQYQAA